MLVLALDTSTHAVTAAVARVTAGSADVGSVDVSSVDVGSVDVGSVEVVARRIELGAARHGELLAPAIAAVMAEAGRVRGELCAIVAGVGPGPFTGLRVGLATALAMAQALTIPSYCVCSLDAIGAATTGLTLVASDARRREVYWAVYRDGTRLTPPAVSKPVEILPELAERQLAPDRAAGLGASMYADVLGLPVHPPAYPLAQALVGLAAQRIVTRAPTERLVPLYLRRPDAVEPLPAPAGRR